ncbi:synaptonemal complex protein 3-like [Lytechinus variegatus]|uniref:synaptonemal complex protein 3-like n=1 Tax=Lytechinus variegatus TaxID=7654 RepID=UPI001BB153D8|nr:synaptonemal complex protein 3-like [Lytechinus variegatus]
MPRAPSNSRKQSGGGGKKKPAAEGASTSKMDFEDDASSMDPLENDKDEDDSEVKKAGKKRSYDDSDEEEELECNAPGINIDGEMQTVLQSFGADMRKSMSGKKKRLETLTQQTLKSTNVKVEKIWKMQQTERQRLHAEYSKQLTTVLDQWDTDMKKMKENEEKLQTMLKQQQRVVQQSCIAMNQRLKNVRQLFEQYNKTMGELEQCHQGQQTNVQGELKKELNLLHKKILMDTQHQEMANFRKSLQSMFF